MTTLINKIQHSITYSFFNSVITVVDDIVFVNLDWLTNRDYQFQGVNEFLYTITQYKNKNIVFLVRDGVNCRVTGMHYLITKIIQELSLTANTCYIYSYDNLEISNTTYIPLDAVQMWSSLVYEQVKDLPLSNNSFTLKFAAMFGRHDMFRLKICRHLYENYKQDSLLSYNSSYAKWNHRFQEQFADDENWYHNHCPIKLDFEPEGWVPYQKSLSNIGTHYQQYFIEVAAETDVYSNKFFTEKTLKNFYLGKPFILFSGPGSLAHLRSLGFKTFAPCINEQYDAIINTHDRFAAVIQEIDRLAKLSITDLKEIHQQLTTTFEYNRQRLTEQIE
jgi:hypothetical protein